MRDYRGFQFFGIALLILIVDQWTKHVVRASLIPGQTMPIIDGFFSLWYVQNTGAGFGLFKEWTLMLAWISVIVLGFILYYFDEAIKERTTLLATALILGGTIGNMIDRFAFQHVTDFFDFSLMGSHWPTFNIADSAIVIGALGLLWHFRKSEAVQEIPQRIKRIPGRIKSRLKRNAQRVFIIHGSYGSPKENWYPWLRGELERLGYRVYVRRLPKPPNQSLQSWRRKFRRYEKKIKPDSIVIGHSLGCAFLLDVLERKKVKSAFFVSGFTGLLHNKFDEVNRTFVSKSFDWEKIRKHCGRFTLLHSNNDPYVPLRKAETLAKKLGASVTVVRGAGHFNKFSGYRKFGRLLREITLSRK